MQPFPERTRVAEHFRTFFSRTTLEQARLAGHVIGILCDGLLVDDEDPAVGPDVRHRSRGVELASLTHDGSSIRYSNLGVKLSVVQRPQHHRSKLRHRHPHDGSLRRPAVVVNPNGRVYITGVHPSLVTFEVFTHR